MVLYKTSLIQRLYNAFLKKKATINLELDEGSKNLRTK